MAETCGICGLEFGDKAALLEHVRGDHHVDPTSLAAAPVAAVPQGSKGTVRAEPFRCGICGTVFPTRERLAHHNLTVDHKSVLTSPHPRPSPPRKPAPRYSRSSSGW